MYNKSTTEADRESNVRTTVERQPAPLKYTQRPKKKKNGDAQRNGTCRCDPAHFACAIT